MSYFELCLRKQQREEIIRHIKEIERKRIEEDTFNVNKAEPLYEVLERLNKIIEEAEK